METAYIAHPLSLGDYFVCNALVIDQVTQYQTIHLPVVPQFMETVKCLYGDHGNIKIVPYLGNLVEQNYIATHKLSVLDWRPPTQPISLQLHGESSASLIDINYDRQIYENLGCCFNKRYQGFQLPASIPLSDHLYTKLNPDDQPYVLWHKYTSKHVGGIPIPLEQWRPSAGLPEKKIINVELGQTTNMLDYVKLIINADEIHCVHSSFYQLVDSLGNKPHAQLFYHDYRKDTINQINCRWNNHRWNRVDYGGKI
jgi:hypothetical protein